MIGSLMICLVVALCAKYIYSALIETKACLKQLNAILSEQTTAHTNMSINICSELKGISDVISDAKNNDA
jgi:hypothetical protein